LNGTDRDPMLTAMPRDASGNTTIQNVAVKVPIER
jgi:hypothetical protein